MGKSNYGAHARTEFPVRTVKRTEYYKSKVTKGQVRFDILECGHIVRLPGSAPSNNRHCGVCVDDEAALERHREWILELADYRLKDRDSDPSQ